MKPNSWLTSVILAGSLSAVAVPALAIDVPNKPHISTSGRGLVEVTPDMAILNIVVELTASKASDAKQQVDQRVARYFDFLQQQGVAKQDIDAANINTQPQYDYSKQSKPILTGYQATRQITVKVRQVDKLNDLLNGALKQGLNEIRSVTPQVSDPARYQQQARDLAIKDAIAQGRALAAGFGDTLGPVWSIDYNARAVAVRPEPRVYGLAKSSADTTEQQTYQKNAISFDDKVNVVFELLSSHGTSSAESQP